jgi:hypothetical protein
MPRSLFVLPLLLFCFSCAEPQEPPPTPLPTPADSTTSSAAGQYAYGQTIYVPAYSHIYYQNHRRVINLATTLSIRNTDLQNPLTITAVRYYDSEGKLVRHYIEQPLRLGPMASKAYVVEVNDTSGGSGANFIVEWGSDQAITQPVMEAVMISTASTQGISFVTTGRVLKDRTAIASE